MGSLSSKIECPLLDISPILEPPVILNSDPELIAFLTRIGWKQFKGFPEEITFHDNINPVFYQEYDFRGNYVWTNYDEREWFTMNYNSLGSCLHSHIRTNSSLSFLMGYLCSTLPCYLIPRFYSYKNDISQTLSMLPKELSRIVFEKALLK